MSHSEMCSRERSYLRKKADGWIKNGYRSNWATRWLRDFLRTWSVEKLRKYLLKFDYDSFELDPDIPELTRYMRIGWRRKYIDKESGKTCYDFIRQRVRVASKGVLIKFFARLVKYAKNTNSEFFDVEFEHALKRAGYNAYEEYRQTCNCIVAKVCDMGPIQVWDRGIYSSGF